MDAKDRRNRGRPSHANRRPIKKPKPRPAPVLVLVDESLGVLSIKAPRGAVELRIVYEQSGDGNQSSALPALWRTLARDPRGERARLRYLTDQEWVQRRRAFHAAMRTIRYVRLRLGLPVRGELTLRWMDLVLDLAIETGLHPRDIADQLAEVREEVAEQIEQELLDSGDWVIVN